MHIGQLDDWTPAATCTELGNAMAARGEDLLVTTYPDSYHAFDSPTGTLSASAPTCPTASIRAAAFTSGPNPVAREAANASVRAFLRQRLAPDAMPTDNPDPCRKPPTCTVACIASLMTTPLVAQPLQPDIMVTRMINAPVADVWQRVDDTEGIESFFAPKAARSFPSRAARSSCGSASTTPKDRAAAKDACSTA